MAVQDARFESAFRAVRWYVTVVVCVCAPVLTARLSAEQIDVRLRLQWGHGIARSWKATVRVTAGAVSEPRPLGHYPDEPGSMWIDRGALQILQPSPRDTDGVDFLVRAPRDATLVVDIAPQDQLTASRSLQMPLARFLEHAEHAPRSKLDDQGNDLNVRRAPGDRLRVQIERESLVYWTGDTFAFKVLPTLTGLPPGSDYRLQMQIRHTRGGAMVWEEERAIEVDSSGNAQATETMETRLDQDGVYDLVVAVARKRPRLSTPLRPLQPFLNKPLKTEVERRVQFAVVNSTPRPFEPTAWKLECEIDPTNTRWWESVIRLPQWRVFANLRKGQLGNAKPAIVQQLQRRFSQLDTDGWQAYPLTVRTPGQPHVLEIDYPTDQAQLLTISIIEPTGSASVKCASIDSGVHVPNEPSVEPGVATHRLTFWPRTKSPLVLLTNRHAEQAAVFGALRVYSTSTVLPNHASASSVNPQRLVAAFYSTPAFPQNFGVDEFYDQAAGRSIVDWQTFYLGTHRLVEYLKYAGYNGAFVPVMCDGSAIYPSDLLQATTQYDTGTLTPHGQDPVRKDVLELMFRIFDREGLRLVPVLHFASPLPELEAHRRADRANAHGIMLIGAHGRSWMESHRPASRLAPRYNPLNSRVQTAIRRVTDEVVTKYSQHDAFAGIAWQMTPDTFTQLPDSDWAYDGETVSAFLTATRVNLPRRTKNVFQNRAIYLNNEGRQAWLEWRAERLTTFYDQVGKDIERRKPSARLFLTSAHLLTGSTVEPFLRPQLPPQTNEHETMLRLGIDVERIQRLDSTVMLQPNIVAHGQSIGAHAGQIALKHQFEINAPVATSGSMIYHHTTPFTLPEYDQLSPFGVAQTTTSFTPQLASSQHYQRKPWIDCLKNADRQLVISGGPMLTLGQEESQRVFVNTFRELPPIRFSDVVVEKKNGAIQPVTLRAASFNGHNYLYLLNDSRWPITVKVFLATSPLAKLEALGGRSLQPLRVTGRDVEWTVPMKPYDIVAVRCQDDLGVNQVTVTNEQRVFVRLAEQIKILRARVLASDATSEEIEVANSDFDQEDHGQPTAWIHTPLPPDGSLMVRANPIHDEVEGKALKLSSRGPVGWVRSDPIASPKLGRLKLSVRLRTPDANRQPRLRLAIQGQVDGAEYYRFAQVGDGPAGVPQLTSEWKDFEILFDHLPLQALQDLRIGFDLMGPGEVWIDDVRVTDTWFRKVERDELLKSVALARFHLRTRQVSDCQAVLDNYWSQFLRENVEINVAEVIKSESPQNEKTATLPPAPENATTTPTVNKPTGLRAWLPKFFR